RGITAARDHDAADPRTIVARIEGKPAPIKIHLKPGAEIHRRRIGRNADVAEVARAIARRDIHAAAQRHRQMRKITAHADAFFVAFPGRAVAPRMVITETDPLVDVVANRLHTLPARSHGPKE